MLDANPRANFLEEPGPAFVVWLEQIARELVMVSGAVGSTLWFWSETEQALQVEASCRISDEYLAYGNQVARMSEAKSKAPVYLAYRTGATIELESPKADPAYAYFTEGFQDAKIGFVYTAPIGLMHQRLGAIALYYSEPVAVTEAQALRIQTIAAQIAGLRLQHELRRALGAKITELAGANAYLTHANDEMKAIDRLKGNFMSAVSHELRTPLTSIMGYMELLEDEIGGPLTPKQREFVGHVQDASQNLLGIVDNVLDFVRLEAGTFQLILQDTDLSAIVRKAIASLAPQLAASELALDLSLPDTPVMARVDSRRLGQVLLNLLANAIKFTPAGGRVAVRLRECGPQAVLDVADSGIGISSEHVPRLFDKFFQVEPGLTRNYGGVGLGLAIVKAFVGAHHGAVSVHSQPGAGTTFTLTLPLMGPDAGE